MDSRHRFLHVFRALKHRNYALFFTGQGLSLVGTWLQQAGEVWLAWRLTHSPYYLGIVGFASQIPTFFLAPVAGAYLDRWNRHRLVLGAQILAMIHAFVLGALVLTGRITLANLIVLSVIGGIIDALEIPARQSFVIELVGDPADLSNAIALNSSLVNVARLIGPTLAGFLIAAVGEGWCFLLNGMSYGSVILALVMMKVTPRPRRKSYPPITQVLREGIAYAANPHIAILLGTLALVSLWTASYSGMAPLYATQLLHGGPHTLGFLMASSGLGALTAALYMASRQSVIGLGRVIARGTALLGFAFVCFSFSRDVWLSCLLNAIGGFGMMSSTASMNTMLQTVVEEDQRGRVMSFFTMAFIGMAPLGNLLGGYLAGHLTPALSVRIAGAAVLAVSGIFLWNLPRLRESIRPIYAQLGILPAVASGLQTTMTGPRRST